MKTKTISCRQMFTDANCSEDVKFPKCATLQEAFTSMIIHSRIAHKDLLESWDEKNNESWMNDPRMVKAWENLPYDKE